jgi:hypothetical protein
MGMVILLVVMTILLLYNEPSYLYIDLIPKSELHNKCAFLRRLKDCCYGVLGITSLFLGVRLTVYILDNIDRKTQVIMAGIAHFLEVCLFGLLFAITIILFGRLFNKFSNYMRCNYLKSLNKIREMAV